MSSGLDMAVVVAGRVVEVHRRGAPARVPAGGRVIAAATGMVAPGMLYDDASRSFLAVPPPPLALPRSRLSHFGHDTVVVHQPVVRGEPVVPAAQALPASGNTSTNTITINVNSPGYPAPAPPPFAPAVPLAVDAMAPGVVPLPPASRDVSPPAASPPAQPAVTASPDAERARALEALRGLQREAWPPERERVADLAAVFVAYGDAAAVPELAAMVPAGMTLDQVARVALAARETCQGWISAIGRLIEAEVPGIRTAADADRVIRAGRAIVEA